jgi:hypothetical protein
MSSRSKESPKARSLEIAIESSGVHSGIVVSSRAVYSEGSECVSSQAFTPSL